MPESMGYEIPIALKLGFTPEEIYMADVSAAKIAALAIHQLPRWFGKELVDKLKSNRQGKLLSRACPIFYKAGHCVGAAHFDFKGNLDGPAVKELTQSLQSGFIKRDALVGVTFSGFHDPRTLKELGNNQRHSLAVLRYMPENHQGRVIRLHDFINRVVGNSSFLVSAGNYYNGKSKSPMVWAIFELGRY